MTTASVFAAASADDRGPISRGCNLDEYGAFTQSLADHTQRGLRNAHVTAGTLAFCFRRAMQMHARSRVTQRARHGVETHSPPGTNESLRLHRARERSDE